MSFKRRYGFAFNTEPCPFEGKCSHKIACALNDYEYTGSYSDQYCWEQNERERAAETLNQGFKYTGVNKNSMTSWSNITSHLSA